MALTTEQKVDLLLKKIGYTKTKTGSVFGTGSVSGTGKQPFGEAIPSPLIVANASLWNEADSIPATPPGSDTNQVKRYPTTSALRMTLDTTVTPNRSFIAYTTYNNTSSARLTNWIDTQFGPDYQLEVYVDDATDPANKLPEGGSGSNDGWYFDYSAGVLNFSDTSIPSGVNGAGTNVYIVGYRYVGQTGAPTSGISTFSYLDLTVERNLDVGKQGGISTFHNNIDLNADLDVDGHTNLDNVSVAGVSTFTGLIDAEGGIIVDDYLELFHYGGTNFIRPNNGSLDIITPGGSHNIARFIPGNGVELWHTASKKFNTTSTGAFVTGILTVSQDLDVDGHTNLDNLSVAGVSTFTGAIDLNADLDVDGHTNLDNVSVAGVSTFQNDVHLLDNDNLYIGGSAGTTDGIRIRHNGNNSFVRNTNRDFYIGQESSASNFGLYLHAGNEFYLKHYASNGGQATVIKSTRQGAFILYHGAGNVPASGTERLVTTSTGINFPRDIDVDGHTNLDNISVAGVSTFTGDATFSGNVSIGGTLTYEDVTNVDSVGLLTARSGIRVTGGVIEALAGENKIPSLYSAMNNLPSAGSYHGMFAHVHATGRGYFAHAGNWLELVNKEVNGVVGTGTERYNIGPVDLTTLDVSGISTFAGNVDINADIDVDGHTNLDNVSISGVTTTAGNVDINAQLDVSGQASLSGFTTTTSYGLTTRDLYTTGITTVFKSLHVNGRYANNDGIMPFVVTHGGYQGIQTSKFTASLNNYPELVLENTWGGNWNTTGPWKLKWTSPNESASGPAGNRTLAELMPAVNNPGALSGFRLRTTDGSTGLKNVFLLNAYNSSFYINNSSGQTTALRLDEVGVGITNYIYHYGNSPSDTHTRFGFASNGIIQFDVDGTERFRLQQNLVRFSNLSVGVDIDADLDVDGHTNLDNVSVAGVSTFTASTYHNGNIVGDNLTNISGINNITAGASGGKITISNNLPILELIDTNSNSDFEVRVNNGVFSIRDSTNSDNRFNIASNGNVSIVYDLDVDGHTNLDNVNIVGVTTAAGHILPETHNTYDLGSTSKQWRKLYVGNIVSAPGFGFLGEDLTVRNFTATGISTHVGIATFNNATFHDDVTFEGNLDIDDNAKAIFGASDDLQIYHSNSSHASIIRHYANDSGNFNDLFIDSGRHIKFRSHSNGSSYENMAIFNKNGAVELYYDNLKKFQTTSTGINVTGLTDTDTLLSSGNATFSGTITAGGGTGTNGQYLKTTGSGVEWATFPTLRTRQTSTASAGQTTFSFSYTVNFLDVFVNGIKLTDAEFTATNGSSVVLAVGCFVGDIVELVSYNTVSGGGGGGGGGSLNNIVEDTTPQLGGNLDLFNKTITGTGNINMTGVATATKFVGDGSGLTNVIGSGSGVVVKNSGSNVGTAGTIDFGSNLSVSAISAGIVTITGSIGITTNSGVVSIANNLDVDGDIDVDGHTNLDNVSITGVTTTTNHIDIDADDKALRIGDGQDIQIFHNSTASGGRFANSSYIENNTGNLFIRGIVGTIIGSTSGEIYAQFLKDDKCELRFDNNVKFVTTNTGVTVTGTVVADGADINGDIDVNGHTELDNVNIAGVVTAQTYKGALEATSASFSSNIDANGDLDVDGHTNLDNVSVAGVLTATSSVHAGSNLQVNSDVGKLKLGASQDFELYHNGTDSYIDNNTGDLYIQTTGSGDDILIESADDFVVKTAGTQRIKVEETGDIELGSGGDLTTHVGSRQRVAILGNSSNGSMLHIRGGSPAIFFDQSGGNISKIYQDNVNLAFHAGTPASEGTNTFLLTPTGNATFAGNVSVGSSIAVGTGVTIETNGQATYTGIVTALKFVGDGSGLTNLPGGGSYGNNDVDNHLNVSGASSGQILSWNGSDYVWVADQTGGGGSGISTISGVVNIANDLDVDGHTNLDNVSVAGVSTFAGNVDLGDATSDTISFVGRVDTDILPISNGYGTVGNSSLRYGSMYAVNFYGNGTNLTNLPAAQLTGTLPAIDGSNLTGINANVGITTNLSGTFTASAGSPSTINTFGYGSGDIVVEYTVFIKNGSDFQSQKLLAMRDGTTIHSTQFAVMFSSSLLVQLDATISGSNILLRATPETGVSGSTTYKVKREVM